jgi:hypothetical protein
MINGYGKRKEDINKLVDKGPLESLHLLQIEEYKGRNDEVLQYLNLRDGYIDLRPWGVTEVICQTKKK